MKRATIILNFIAGFAGFFYYLSASEFLTAGIMLYMILLLCFIVKQRIAINELGNEDWS